MTWEGGRDPVSYMSREGIYNVSTRLRVESSVEDPPKGVTVVLGTGHRVSTLYGDYIGNKVEYDRENRYLRHPVVLFGLPKRSCTPRQERPQGPENRRDTGGPRSREKLRHTPVHSGVWDTVSGGVWRTHLSCLVIVPSTPRKREVGTPTQNVSWSS